MSDRDVREEMIASLQRKMEEAKDQMVRDLNRAIYEDGQHLYSVSYTYAKPRRFVRLRRYFLNWLDALRAVGRAIIGRDAIPEHEYDDY